MIKISKYDGWNRYLQQTCYDGAGDSEVKKIISPFWYFIYLFPLEENLIKNIHARNSNLLIACVSSGQSSPTSMVFGSLLKKSKDYALRCKNYCLRATAIPLGNDTILWGLLCRQHW